MGIGWDREMVAAICPHSWPKEEENLHQMGHIPVPSELDGEQSKGWGIAASIYQAIRWFKDDFAYTAPKNSYDPYL